jgi:hypothetical protein
MMKGSLYLLATARKLKRYPLQSQRMQPGPRAASWDALFDPTTAVSIMLRDGPISHMARVGRKNRRSVELDVTSAKI